jgi:hypothetical protein
LALDQQAIIYFKQEYIFQLHQPDVISASNYIINDGEHYLKRPWIDGNNLSKTAHKLSKREAIFF